MKAVSLVSVLAIFVFATVTIGCGAAQVTGPNVAGSDAPEWTNASSGKCQHMGLEFKGICAVGSKRSKNIQHAKTMACDTARGEFTKFLRSSVKAAAKRAAESVSDGDSETYGERTIEGFVNKMEKALDVSAVGCPKGYVVQETDGTKSFYALAIFTPDELTGALDKINAVKELSEKKAAAIRQMSKEVTKELGLE